LQISVLNLLHLLNLNYVIKILIQNFGSTITGFIYQKQKTISKASCKSISTVKQRLLAFEKYSNSRIQFMDINYDFYKKLLHCLSNHHCITKKKNDIIGLKKNSIGKTITIFKTFLREMMRKKVILFFYIDDLKSKQEKVDNSTLTTEEI
jgi:hypothetical protein